MSTPAMSRRACFAILLGLIASASTSKSTAIDEPVASKKTVRLTIDYGDGVQKLFTDLEWKEKMTVLDLMKQGQEHPRGIRFEMQGSGETGLLLKIDDLKNEGVGRNWLYQVNDKLGDRSFAIYSLAAGDVVLWKFGKYK